MTDRPSSLDLAPRQRRRGARLPLVLTAILVALGAKGSNSADVRSGIEVRERRFHGLPNRILCSGLTCHAALDTGLMVLDVSDPGDPRVSGAAYLPGAALDLALDDDVAFVAAGEAGLAVLDLSAADGSRLLATLPLPGEARAIAVDRGLAYVGTAGPGDGTGTLQVIDVRDARAPVAVGAVALDNGVTSVAVRGQVVYAGLGTRLSGRHGVVVIDASVPQSPVERREPSLSTDLPVSRLIVVGDLLYLADGAPSTGAVRSVDIADPLVPRLLASADLANGPRDLSVAGGRLYAAVRESGLRVFDLPERGALVAIGGVALGGPAVTVAAAGTTAIAGVRSSTGAAGIWTVDVSSVTPARRLSFLSQAEATDVFVQPGLSLLLERDALHMIAAGGAPIGSWRMANGDYSRVAAEGSLAAVAEGQRVHILDIADPARPRRVARIDLDSTVVQPLFADGILFLVQASGFDAFDLAVPEYPVGLGGYGARSMATGMVVDGSLGYLLDGSDLVVIDLANLTRPESIAAVEIPGEWLLGIDKEGPRIAVTGLNRALYAIDATDRSRPVLAGALPGYGLDVRITGDRAVVASGDAGVVVVDVSDLARPVAVAGFDTSGVAARVAIVGASLHVATLAAQHWTLDCIACAAPTSSPVERCGAVLVAGAAAAMPGASTGSLERAGP